MVCNKVKLRKNVTHKNPLGCFAVRHRATSPSLTMHPQWSEPQSENNRLRNATKCLPPKKNVQVEEKSIQNLLEMFESFD